MKGQRTCGACALGLLLCLAAAVRGDSAPAGPDRAEQSKTKQKVRPYALLFGTVFDERGMSVRGAAIHVREKDGKKKWEAVTDGRGEFAVHLPAGSRVYLVKASAQGRVSETAEVSFSADERQDVSLRLARKQ